MYSRTLTARASGPIHLTLKGYNSNITVVVDGDCRRAQIEAYADVNSGPTVKLIDGLTLRESGSGVELILPDEASGGTSIVSASGSVVIGNGSVVQSSFGGRTSSVISTGEDADITVGGKRIQVRGNKTWIDGKLVDDGAGSDGEPVGDPPATVHLRAVVPPGSVFEGRSHNGNLRCSGVGLVLAKTHNGHILATGLAEDSTLETHNGTVRVGAADGRRPQVRVKTHNGDITVLDNNVRLRPKTHNGDIRYPR